ncbi:hypothetical protein D3C85_1359400 [compost metagenome]
MALGVEAERAVLHVGGEGAPRVDVARHRLRFHAELVEREGRGALVALALQPELELDHHRLVERDIDGEPQLVLVAALLLPAAGVLGVGVRSGHLHRSFMRFSRSCFTHSGRFRQPGSLPA